MSLACWLYVWGQPLASSMNEIIYSLLCVILSYVYYAFLNIIDTGILQHPQLTQFNSIQDYLHSAFHDTIVAKQVGIIFSQVFGHLWSFKGWIQTEACVIPSYHGILIPWQKQRNK